MVFFVGLCPTKVQLFYLLSFDRVEKIISRSVILQLDNGSSPS